MVLVVYIRFNNLKECATSSKKEKKTEDKKTEGERTEVEETIEMPKEKNGMTTCLNHIEDS